jgi:hypothetical protein
MPPQARPYSLANPTAPPIWPVPLWAFDSKDFLCPTMLRRRAVYLTDLAPYAEFSKVRGEVFPHNPPPSSAVQVAGILLGARIEIDAVAFVAKG